MKRLFVCLVALAIFAACGRNISDQDDTEITFDSVMHQANQRRHEISSPDMESLSALAGNRAPAQLPEHLLQERSRAPVSFYEAVDDVETLFAALQAAYAAWEYFGGDEAFFAAKEGIIAELGNHGEIIQADTLEQVIVGHLGQIVHDNHLQIGRSVFGADIAYFRADGLRYERTGDDFVNKASGLTLKEIEGHQNLDERGWRCLNGRRKIS
ncbi:MAG: hypothetical protein LBE35_05905 [Clostridiales bacterium]|jgi:hypothetical protein|nr:hypothetical protein [Clostridiales bacterium]